MDNLNVHVLKWNHDQTNTIHVNHFILASMNMDIRGYDVV